MKFPSNLNYDGKIVREMGPANSYILRGHACYMDINSLRPSDACMCQWTKSPLVHIMASRLFGAKISEPTMVYFQVDLPKHIAVKFESKQQFSYDKMILKILSVNWRPFVSVSMCWITPSRNISRILLTKWSEPNFPKRFWIPSWNIVKTFLALIVVVRI